MSDKPKVCLIIRGAKHDEPHPLARYYFDPDDVLGWSGVILSETRAGYRVEVIMRATNIGPIFDHRAAGRA